MVVNQARIGVELGSTPWSAVPFRARPARRAWPRSGFPSARNFGVYLER
jgi:hypothetical protein